MARRITIIQGHPDPERTHFCHALADAYADGAHSAAHEVRRIEVAGLNFPLLRNQAEFEHGALPEALRDALDAILAADHIVIIFPLWLGTMPALLKGFLEQLLRPDVAFAYQKKGFPKKLLKGRSCRLIVTMGMPAFFYLWWYGAHGVRNLERNVLGFVGISPVKRTLFGMIGDARGDKAAKRLEVVRELGRRAA